MTYDTRNKQTQQKDTEQFDWLQQFQIIVQNATGSTTKKMLRLIQPCFGKKPRQEFTLLQKTILWKWFDFREI